MKSRQELEKLVISHPQARTEREQICLSLLSAWALWSYAAQYPWVGNSVAPCLSLPISLGNQDCLGPTHKDMPAGQPDLNNSPSKLSTQVTLSCIQPAHSPSQGLLIYLFCHSDGVSRGNRGKGMCLSHCVSLERGGTPGSRQRKQSIKSLSAMVALHTPLRTVPELQCC